MVKESWKQSGIATKYPSYRNSKLITTKGWQIGKRVDDEAEGLWRIHDGIYDFTDFISKHPGGEFWLEESKGMDITEAFESHHITLAPHNLLQKYKVRDAKNPRIYTLTMHEDGFYKTLRERVREKLTSIDNTPKKKSDNLSRGTCPHPKYVTCWNKYPFGELDLEEFFTNSTFNFSETFLGEQYGLNGLTENLEVKSSLHFYMGRCYTLRPKVDLKRTTRSSGYSFMLTHHIKSKYTDIALENTPGWHIYIHDYRQDFTELSVKGSARTEYIFAEIDQEVEIKLQNQHFKTLKSKDHSCSAKPGYSDTKCAELTVFEDLAAEANCTGPWMYGIPQQPCNSSTAMRKLIKEYGIYHDNEDDIECNCLHPCESRIYSTYIQSRRSLNSRQQYTQVWIYYSTKLVSMIEESYSYDSTQFIADIGGSLGFLLGLSVLGFIGLLEHLALFVCGGIIKKQLQREKYIRDKAERESQTSDATNTTVDISTISKEKELY